MGYLQNRMGSYYRSVSNPEIATSLQSHPMVNGSLLGPYQEVLLSSFGCSTVAIDLAIPVLFSLVSGYS